VTTEYLERVHPFLVYSPYDVLQISQSYHIAWCTVGCACTVAERKPVKTANCLPVGESTTIIYKGEYVTFSRGEDFTGYSL